MHDEANKLRAALRRLRAQLSRTMNIQMRMTLSGNIMQMEERLRELEEATARSEWLARATSANRAVSLGPPPARCR
jgi:hypothetical protein